MDDCAKKLLENLKIDNGDKIAENEISKYYLR